MPVLAATAERAPAGVPRGAYTLIDEAGDGLDLVLLATGSEVSLALTARQRLEEAGTPTRVVSMPCREWFDAQDSAYRERVLPTEELAAQGPVQTLRINRLMVDGVVEAPFGAHFTSCAPDYERDETFQREYAATARDDDAWDAFRARYLDVGGHDEYRKAVGL